MNPSVPSRSGMPRQSQTEEEDDGDRADGGQDNRHQKMKDGNLPLVTTGVTDGEAELLALPTAPLLRCAEIR